MLDRCQVTEIQLHLSELRTETTQVGEAQGHVLL